MSNLKKAIIPAAGLGTRFLPATKTIPKEMLPVVDKPILLHVVEEAVEAGIEDIILITGRHKTAIEDFFDRNYELEDTLQKTGKMDLLEKILPLREMVNVVSVRQIEPKGLGHAVLKAASLIGGQNFAVLLGDEMTTERSGRGRALSQLKSLHESCGGSAIAVVPVDDEAVRKYGIVEGEDERSGRVRIRRVIEKPAPSETKSRLGITGRYIFSPRIMDFLAVTKPTVGGEIHLAPAMTELAAVEPAYAGILDVNRLDAGDKLGFLKANVELGLNHQEIGEKFKAYLRQLIY